MAITGKALVYAYQSNAKEKAISYVTVQAQGSLRCTQRIESSCKIGQLVLDTPYNLLSLPEVIAQRGGNDRRLPSVLLSLVVRHIGTVSLRSEHKNDIPKEIEMTPKAFDKLARDHFSETLVPLGFSCEKSSTCTFYRASGNGIWHIVMPDLGTRGAWYDVKVFPCCESLEPLFTKDFPDELGVPTDSFCYLSSKGVGHSQEQFNCKSEENFRNRYQRTVGPLLVQFAVPYLDQIRSLEEMVPVIRSPLYRATAMFLVNKNDETREMVQQQRVRFQGMGNEEAVVAVRDFLDSLLDS